MGVESWSVEFHVPSDEFLICLAAIGGLSDAAVYQHTARPPKRAKQIKTTWIDFYFCKFSQLSDLN